MRSSAGLMKTVTCHGQPSWRFSSNKVDAKITRLGGQLAPVQFHLPHGIVEPFSIAPWAGEKIPADTLPLLRALRGDFFCAPFGGNAKAWRGEKHPVHGESANAPWQFESIRQSMEKTELRLSLKTKVRAGRVDKTLRLRQDETVIYCRHVLSRMSGPMSLGHHAMLKFPDFAGSGFISTSPIRFAQVLPVPFEDPAQSGYQSLKPGANFSRLDHVPMIDGAVADLSRYPDRSGFDDLVMVTHEAKENFAWTAVSFPQEGYVWFALKDPRVLRSTVLWISNGGRHYSPWNSRHVNVIGLEDVTAYFHRGLSESSQPNPINRRGIPTALNLDHKVPLAVNYIMGVAAIPHGFARVKKIIPGNDSITLISTKGQRVTTPVQTQFLYERPA